MLKITVRHDRQETRLVLEGRLMGPWVRELERCWETVTGHDVTIDLTGVTYINDEGRGLLGRMWKRGADLRASGCLTGAIVSQIRAGGRDDQ